MRRVDRDDQDDDTEDRYMPAPLISIAALEGHGKTRVVLTAPKPLDLFYIDPNTEETVEKAIEEGLVRRKDVRLYQVEMPSSVFAERGDLQTEAEQSWTQQLLDPLKEILDRREKKGFIAFDTATELFELKLFADHGKSVQIMPEMRTKTNYQFKGLLSALKRSGRGVVLLHRLKDSYADKERETQRGTEVTRERVDGTYEREGFNRTGFYVNVECGLFFDPTREAKHPSNRYGVKFVRSTQRPSLIGSREFKIDEWVKWGRAKQKDGTRIERASVSWILSQMYPNIPLARWGRV